MHMERSSIFVDIIKCSKNNDAKNNLMCKNAVAWTKYGLRIEIRQEHCMYVDIGT